MRSIICSGLGPSLSLSFCQAEISVFDVKEAVSARTGLPQPLLRVIENGHELSDAQSLDSLFIQVRLCGLVGGKGGFGTLLRGVSKKAGHKKNTNFDAMRDLNGRRMRHVNNAKAIAEWESQASERDLIKVGEKYAKKFIKDEKIEKRLQKDSNFAAKSQEIRQEVEEAVSIGVAQEKALKRTADSVLPSSEVPPLKKMRPFWATELEYADSDSDNSESESDEEDQGDEQEEQDPAEGTKFQHPDHPHELAWKSDVYKDKGQVVTCDVCGKTESESSYHCDECGFDVCVICQRSGTRVSVQSDADAETKDDTPEPQQPREEQEVPTTATTTSETPEVSTSTSDENVSSSEQPQVALTLEKESAAAVVAAPAEPLPEGAVDLSLYGSASDLEALGGDALKVELQRLGLKIGGTVKQRAERLFCVKGLTPDQYPVHIKAKK